MSSSKFLVNNVIGLDSSAREFFQAQIDIKCIKLRTEIEYGRICPCTEIAWVDVLTKIKCVWIDIPT